MANPSQTLSRSPDPAGLREEAVMHLGVAALGLAVGAAAFGLAYGAALPATLIALGLFLPIAAIVAWKITAYHPFPVFGWPNVVTTARATLTCLFAAGIYLATDNSDPILGWSLTVLAVGALILDGVDGYLARRFDFASPFGARYDMEVDAVLILALAVAAWVMGKAGPWVLASGLIRYAFLAAGWVWAPLRAELPHSTIRRKAVCVLQTALLCLVIMPITEAPTSDGLAILGLILLVLSFIIDIRWLVLTARRPKA